MTTPAVQRYLEMYARLDEISDEEESADIVDEMQSVWDTMSPAQRKRAHEVRERITPQIRGIDPTLPVMLICRRPPVAKKDRP